jgi:hypothetical protein
MLDMYIFQYKQVCAWYDAEHNINWILILWTVFHLLKLVVFCTVPEVTESKMEVLIVCQPAVYQINASVGRMY